uniref:Oligosaccharyltransferase complex subunit n=1 Tax=Meloidogyne hapla TaxID=6305 RepID=A0A1I8B6B9_MELHA
MVTYFLVTGGSTVDERGHNRPVAIMPYRINGQYIMEGLGASFMFCLGGIGLILLDKCNSPLTTKSNRMMLFFLGFGLFVVGFFTTRMFMRMKLPDYLSA